MKLKAGRHRYELALPEGRMRDRIEAKRRPYELTQLRAVAAVAPPSPTIIDVGANIGNHTAWWALVCGATVHAYEPNPEALVWLELNTAELPTVTVHPIALGEQATVGAIRAGRELGHATVAIGQGEIPVERIDDRHESADVIKVDVEGADLAVLRGAERLLRESRPIITVEAWSRTERTYIDEFLDTMGYLRHPLPVSGAPTWLYVPDRRLWWRAVTSPTVASSAARVIGGRVHGRLRRLRRRLMRP